MPRRVTIPEARELSQLREYTIHWRPGLNALDHPDHHFALAERHSLISGQQPAQNRIQSELCA